MSTISLIQRLVSANTFNVTILARHDSTSKFNAPAGVRVLKVDYDSHSDLVKAFEGQEVLIITAGEWFQLDKLTKVNESYRHYTIMRRTHVERIGTRRRCRGGGHKTGYSLLVRAVSTR